MTTTVQFTITQAPTINHDGNGNLTSVVLVGRPVFKHLTQITIDSNGTNPTQGMLTKSSIKGTIDAIATELSQVANAVQGMVPPETRVLEITGTEDTTTFSVSAVSVDVPGAKLISHITGLRPESDTGTATAG